MGDELRLTEDLHLDSLGRVQLAAAIEERLGIVPEDGMWDHVQTLGDLRRFSAPSRKLRRPRERSVPHPFRGSRGKGGKPPGFATPTTLRSPAPI